MPRTSLVGLSFLVVLSAAPSPAADPCEAPRLHATESLAAAAAQDRQQGAAFDQAAQACAERGDACDLARRECAATLTTVAQRQQAFDEGVWLRDMLLPWMGQRYPLSQAFPSQALATDSSCQVDLETLAAAGQRRVAQARRREALLGEYSSYTAWVNGELAKCQARAGAEEQQRKEAEAAAVAAAASKAKVQQDDAAVKLRVQQEEAARLRASQDAQAAQAAQAAQTSQAAQAALAAQAAARAAQAAQAGSYQQSQDMQARLQRERMEAEARLQAQRSQQDQTQVQSDRWQQEQRQQAQAWQLEQQRQRDQSDQQARLEGERLKQEPQLIRERAAAEAQARKDRLEAETREREQRLAEKREAEAVAKAAAEEKARQDRLAGVASKKAQKTQLLADAEARYQVAVIEEKARKKAAADAVHLAPGVAQSLVADAATAEKARLEAEKGLAEARVRSERIEIDDSFERSRGHVGLGVGGGATGWGPAAGVGLGAQLTAHFGFWGQSPLSGLASGFELDLVVRYFGPIQASLPPGAFEGLLAGHYFFGFFGVGLAGEFRLIDAAAGFRAFGGGPSIGLAMVDTPHLRVLLNAHWLPLGTSLEVTRLVGELDVSWEWLTVRLEGGPAASSAATATGLAWQAGLFVGARLSW